MRLVHLLIEQRLDTSTSLHSKKKEARKIEPPQINNECIEKALLQLTGAVMEVGYLLKCILVVLVFFGLTFQSKLSLEFVQNGGPFGVVRWSWPYKWDAVEETDYWQTPTSPAARWLSQRNDEVEEIAVARTPRNMVSDGSRAGGVCRTPGRECLFWPMPPYYSYYLLYSSSTTSIEDSRCWLHSRVQYGHSRNTRTTREACQASTNSVLLLLIGLIR